MAEFIDRAAAMSTESVAYRLRITRMALGVTAAELCRRSGIKPTAWSMYESAERRISLNDAIRLKQTFSIPLDWTFCADPSELPYALTQKMAGHEKDLSKSKVVNT